MSEKRKHIPTAQGHKARKRFGQNFLHDHHVIDKIVRAINPRHSDALVEIGPGMGRGPLPNRCWKPVASWMWWNWTAI